jgi:photosystem II stability/assembly factor-like uncharacterized protein
MADQSDLESLYQEAQAAISSRKYDHASELLKQILVIDENYKDASRLLAQIVKLKRRRWYNDPRLWGGLGVIIIIAFLTSLIPKLHIETKYQPTITNTTDPTLTLAPTKTAIPSQTPTPVPTSLPLIWKRVSPGEDFPRDTIILLTVDPNDPDVIYVATENAGIYKTIDGGHSWAPAQQGLTQTTIYSLIADPQKSGTLYAGLNGEFLETTDGGASWQRVPLDLDKDVAVLMADPHGHDVLYFFNGGNVFTENGDDEWTQVKETTCPDNLASLAVHPADASILMTSQWEPSADCMEGVYLSVDGGHNWKSTYPERGFSIISWNIGSKDEEEIYAITGFWPGMENSGDLYISQDRGKSWILSRKMFAKGIAPSVSGYSILYSGNSLFGVENSGNTQDLLSTPSLEDFRTVVVSPHDPNTIYLGGATLLVSTDGGRTWEQRTNGIGASRLELRIAPWDSFTMYVERVFGERLFYGRQSPLLRSLDGGHTWKFLTDVNRGLVFDADGKTIYRPRSGSLYRSPDQGNTWQFDYNAPIDYTTHPIKAGVLYGFSNPSGPMKIYISSNRGDSWMSSDGDFGDVGVGELFAFSDRNNNPSIFIFTENAIFRSIDDAKSWQECEYINYAKLDTRMVIDPRNSNHIFLVSSDGIHYSPDGCKSWFKHSTGLGSLSTNSIAIDPQDPDTLYLGTDGGAYVSFDSGQTWNQINGGLLGVSVVYSIAVDKESNVYTATPYGIFKLENQ